MRESGPRRLHLAPHALFFPAAALYAAVALPWSVLAMTGVVPGPALLATPFGHAHEMLLGYALAVVAGNQLPPMPRARALSLFALWVAARLTFIVVGNGVALVFDMAFAVALALHVAPRLFRAAKKVRNQALPLVLATLCAGAVAFDAGMFVAAAAAQRAILGAIVMLLGTLMLFMGGRIIAPAAAGQRYRQGESMAARVQPRIEALLLATMAVAGVSALLPGSDFVLRIACATAGALALLRLARWRLWACKGRRDNTMLLKARRAPSAEWVPSVATALVGVATVLRVAAAHDHAHAVLLLLLAAVCWSSAFSIVSALLARTP